MEVSINGKFDVTFQIYDRIHINDSDTSNKWPVKRFMLINEDPTTNIFKINGKFVSINF